MLSVQSGHRGRVTREAVLGKMRRGSVDDIPDPGGWPKTRARLTYHDAYQRMVGAGISHADALAMLTELYADTAECFGGSPS